MSTAEWSVVIAALAFIVSIISLILSHNTNSKQTMIQQRLLAIEENREAARSKETQSAHVYARIDRTDGDREIVIENRGVASAKQVRVLLDDKPLLDHDLIPTGQEEVKELGSHATARYKMAVTMGAQSKVKVDISWNDSSGNPGIWRSSLLIY